MAHYAFLDDNNIVTQVITGRNEDEVVDGISDWEEYYGNFRGQKCIRTSYNNNIRKQYAGIGFTYNEEADVFIAPQPYPSWSLDANHDWQAPTPKPDGNYYWDETSLSWLAFTLQTNKNKCEIINYMAAIDFPNSPSVNDTFDAAGKKWLYNGSTWTLVGVSTAGPGNSYNLDGGTAATVYGGITALSGGGATG